MDSCFDVRRCDAITLFATINVEKNILKILRSSTDPPAEPGQSSPHPYI